MAALTPNQLDMIRAIASNDMPRARKAAQAALAEDESKKNYWDVGELKRMLDPSMNPWLPRKCPPRSRGSSRWSVPPSPSSLSATGSPLERRRRSITS